MSYVITVASHKGGVGKTTTVLNLGYALAHTGTKVLLVDADPQGGLGLATALAGKGRGGLVQVLRGELPVEEAITPSRDPALAVLGSGIETPDDVVRLEDAARDGSLGRALAALPGDRELALVDAPAGIGSLVHALLAASDALLAVTTAKALSVRGLPMLLRAQERAKGENGRLRFLGLLVTMFEAVHRSDWELRTQLRRELPGAVAFRTVIPHDAAVEAASQRCLPLALAERTERAAAAYAEAAAELRNRLHPPAGGPGEEGPYGLF